MCPGVHVLGKERDQTLDNKHEISTLDLSVILGARLRHVEIAGDSGLFL